jgi:hypothetical protein
MSKKLACFLVALSVFAAGCGKEGPPSPPVPDVPRPVSDLVVSQRGESVILQWSYPSLTTSGKSLDSIQKIVVYRFDEPLPLSLAESQVDTSEEVPRDIALFAQLSPPTAQQFKRRRLPAAELAGDALPAYTSGTLIIFEDSPPLRSTDGLPMRYTYSIVTEGRRVESDLSNLVSIVPQAPPASPEKLIARMSPEVVQLAWNPTISTASGEGEAFLIGYRVYRSFLGESVSLLNEQPVADPIYDDRPAHGTYTYFVTAVTALEPDIESELSGAVTVEFRDMLPPPTPTNVTALVEDDAVRLIWDPVISPDLAGYIVYRWDGVAKIRLTKQLVTETSYRDEDAAPGVGYVYGLTSVDTNGNESAQAVSETVSVTR